MKNTVNARLSELLKTSGMTPNELAKRCVDVDHSVIYRILKGETEKPSRKTLEPIAKVFDVSTEWLHKGIGPKERQANELTGGAGKNPWEAEAYQQLKAERDALKVQLERVWATVQLLSGGKLQGFHKAVKESGFPMYHLPGAAFGKPLIAQG